MSIKHLTNQTVTIANPDGTRTQQGKANFGSATSYDARVEQVNKTMATDEKENEPIDLSVQIDTTDTIERGAKLTYSSATYRVMLVEEVVGYNGTRHHLELECQLWNL